MAKGISLQHLGEVNVRRVERGKRAVVMQQILVDSIGS